QFVDNIWKHLKAGFMAWLFGSLAEAGIEIPSDFSLGSILKLVLQVLGLTYDRIRAKAVKLIGERNVMLLEKAWELISALIKGGPAALWEKIKEFLGNLKEMVINAIQEWVVSTVIKSAITKLATMFSPVGAIIQAIITIYNTVMFFIERMNQILALVEAIINSVHKIATGDLSSAANWVEQAMARTIPVIIGFLARLLGLSGISEKIKEIIKKIQGTVDKAVDKLIDKIVKGIGKLFGKGKADEKGSGDPQHDAKVQAGLLAIDQEDEKLQKEEKTEKADAEKVAAKVKKDHPVFKSISVIESEDSWDYDYVASPGKKKKGPRRGAAGAGTASPVTMSTLKSLAQGLDDSWVTDGGERHFRNKAAADIWIRFHRPTKARPNFGAHAALRSGSGGGNALRDAVNKQLTANKLIGGITVPTRGRGGINYHTETMVFNITKGIISNNPKEIKQVDVQVFSFFEICGGCESELKSVKGAKVTTDSVNAKFGIVFDSRYEPPGDVARTNPNYIRAFDLIRSAKRDMLWFKTFKLI
ncbi:MAG: hypothetical protein J2P36_27160, partial [Ktedonobacteraceae bacterium]|nr:hypothetical protein [Ktedonobacteraceae bacterium]